MQFRTDINGLRAIAVIAVVLFHFDNTWVSGGFAGVDVFFVISGFLMTSIIFKGIEQSNFSILKFYISRANRIIPALAFLCFTLMIFGWFYLTPYDYSMLGKHIRGSITFISNVVYWKESGYFDTDSNYKWLLHTWSLSVEWQFYIIYPIILVYMRKVMNIEWMKITVLTALIISFVFSAIMTYREPHFSYFLLPTRAWEMLAGGVAFLFPITLRKRNKILFEYIGFLLIIGTYFLVSKDELWPGYLALLPVLGTYFIIQAQRTKSLLTGNLLFQKLGKYSYSIYLWHWPLVVAMHYFSLQSSYIYIALPLSVLLGFLSYKFIEKKVFKNSFHSIFSLFKYKPIMMVLSILLVAAIIRTQDGFINLAPEKYKYFINNAQHSPLRSQCHLQKYQDPSDSCEYFTENNITWATLGDSHSTEIAYALAKKLQLNGIGLKHFSYSGCKISYSMPDDFTDCAKWYNEAVNYILDDKKIRNVVINHRFITSIFDVDDVENLDQISFEITDDVINMVQSFDDMVFLLAGQKENIYLFYPIPELPNNIKELIRIKFRKGNIPNNIIGTSREWYQLRNKYMIDHFDNANYPNNVHLLKPQDIFCDTLNCYAVKDGEPLYFDDDHPSIIGATELIESIKIK